MLRCSLIAGHGVLLVWLSVFGSPVFMLSGFCVARCAVAEFSTGILSALAPFVGLDIRLGDTVLFFSPLDHNSQVHVARNVDRIDNTRPL